MKTKVCHVLSDVYQSHLIETFGEVMDKDRYEVCFVFMGQKKPLLYDFFQERGYAVEFFEFGGRSELPVAAWKLRKILKRLRPDIVHTHLVEASAQKLAALRAEGLIPLFLLATLLRELPRPEYYVHQASFGKILTCQVNKFYHKEAGSSG